MSAPDSRLSRIALNTHDNDVFRLLVDSVKDYAIFVLSPDGNVLTWNYGAQALKGYTKEEILGQHFSKFYLPEAVESGWPMRELAMADKEGRFADEGWRVRKDGSVFWASVIITALRDSAGHLSGFAKITKDMSEQRDAAERINNLNRELRRKVAELDESRHIIELRTLELQKLSAEVMHVQDDERRRIARELHDDLGQQLSLLKMLLSRSASSKDIEEIASSALSTVRNLSYLLHPPLLDESGLRAALEWFIEGLAKRSCIEITLQVRPDIFPRLGAEIETAIFRVIQEALMNAVRHAKTESARVEIEKQPELVVVRVRDYGQGLPAELASLNGGQRVGVGISGMRERIRQFGGELTVTRSEPGTLVEATIPLFI